MSNDDEIDMHVEAIVAALVAGGLRDPAWIANAYIERIDPDRKLPDLVNGACAAYVQHVARGQLGIAEPKGSYAKPVPSIRAKEVRDSLRLHANALSAWYTFRTGAVWRD
jgi:hypothetical protein